MFMAECQEVRCLWTAGFEDYLERQMAVGEHRLSTGHTVDMSEAPTDTSTSGPRG